MHDVEALHRSAINALASGNHDLAAVLAGRAVALDRRVANHHNTLGTALAGLGRLEEAAASYRRATRLAPDEPGLWCNLGLILCRLGRNREAVGVFRRALALDPTSARSPAQSGLAQALYPGDDYRAVLSAIHETLRPATYVEIGVSTGASLALVRAPTVAIGIDPAPRLSGELPASIRIVPLTSDRFFAEHDLRAAFGGRGFDLAFVDGLHTFEQTLTDIANLERQADPDSVILVHDVLPADEACAARDCRSALWAGDTWKIVPVLRRIRPDLTLFLIPTAPTGLAVIRGLTPARAGDLTAALKRSMTEVMALTFADFVALEGERRGLMIANEGRAIEEYLR